jgi:hypothetical protein
MMGARMVVGVVAGWLLWSATPAVASTFTVTNTRASGPGSLAAVVAAANVDATAPTVVGFAPGVHGIINLTGGELTINRSMSIEGPGAGVVAVVGAGHQILSVPSGSTQLSISGLEFSGGVASSQGGAIVNEGVLSVSDSVFADNVAGGPGGAGGSSGFGQGGAIFNIGSLTVTDSTFTDNAAGGDGGSGIGSGEGDGGAIFNEGPLTVAGSTFTANTGGGIGGTGLSSGEGVGGAIANEGSISATIVSSTFTANLAGGAAGTGPGSGAGQGGALFNSATETLIGDTIDANIVGASASSGGAGINNVGSTSTVTGTIVSGNAGAANCSGSLSATDSLEGPAGQTSCGFDLPSADPLLGPLADNGGPTETQALGAGSPAIGAVAAAGNCPATDQRGAARPAGGCDAGAYQHEPPVVGSATASGVGFTTASIAATVSNPDVQSGTVTFQYGTSTGYGTSTAAQALAAGVVGSSFGAPLSGLVPGTTYHFRVVAQNPDGTVFGPDQQFTTSSAASPPPPPPSNAFTFGKAMVAPGGKITLTVNAPGSGTFAAKATFTVTRRKGKKRVATTFTYGTVTARSAAAGVIKLVIGLKPAAARELKLLGSRQVTIAVIFTPSGGTARARSVRLTIRRSPKGKYS